MPKGVPDKNSGKPGAFIGVPVEERVEVRKWLFEELSSKVRRELDRTIQVNDKEVASFVIKIFCSTKTQDEFRNNLHSLGLEFGDHLITSLHRVLGLFTPKDRSFDTPKTDTHGRVGGNYNIQDEDKALAQTTNLFCSAMPRDMGEPEFLEVFSMFGKFKSAKLLPDPYNPRRNKGYGFVEYRTRQSALAAMEAMQGHKFPRGKKTYVVRIKWALSSRDFATYHRMTGKSRKKVEVKTIALSSINVYIANLPPSINDEHKVHAIASRFGQVKRPKARGKPVVRHLEDQHAGLVRYANPEQAYKAFKTINTMEEDVDGYTLSARFAVATHGEPTRECSAESIHLYKGYNGYERGVEYFKGKGILDRNGNYKGKGQSVRDNSPGRGGKAFEKKGGRSRNYRR